jgi:cobalamin biosynthesis Mg chelatase CobN
MKMLKLALISVLVGIAGVSCSSPQGKDASVSVDPKIRTSDAAKLQRELGLRLHLDVLKELQATGQTNLAAKVDRMVEAMLLQESTSDIRVVLGVLRRLRNHGTNALVAIESDLDEAILALSHFDDLGPDQVEALASVRAYRGEYPHDAASPETRAEVARMLDLANGK